MSVKVSSDNYPEIIEVYNNEGRKAAYDLIRSKYGVEYPINLISRLKKKASLGYDRETDRFQGSSKKENEIFLNLEELCGGKNPGVENNETRCIKMDRTEAMENMVHSLINDRLLELSKYVLLDPVGRQILINRTCMQADGYCVMIN